MVEGFIENGHNVQVLSMLPAYIAHVDSLEEDGIRYKFINYKNKIGVKHFQVALDVCRKINDDGFFKADIIICDTLNVSMYLGALIARLVGKIKLTAIVTDLPNSVSKYEKGLKHLTSSFLSGKYIASFDYYVLQTRQMNDVVNPKNKPYIVMEGVCDLPNYQTYNMKPRDSKRKLLYAGGRPSKDGVDLLIAAFRQLPYLDAQLDIYGSMPDVELGHDLLDSRIIYHGKTENSIIAKAENESFLLINPRPTSEEYTKYSFPSKVMEYMASGTPMVTTKLAGIPKEYFEYAYTFEEYSVECYRRVLDYIFNQPLSVHQGLGIKAREYVMKNKNKVVQTQRILTLYK